MLVAMDRLGSCRFECMEHMLGAVLQVFEMMMGFLLDVEDEPLWHKGDSDQVGKAG